MWPEHQLADMRQDEARRRAHERRMASAAKAARGRRAGRGDRSVDDREPDTDASEVRSRPRPTKLATYDVRKA